ncbi:MAG: hypothetical protein CMP76_08695 [Flavobacterium sp.]|uniref:phytanoyl-CoA dioxygenase family protein n=1 Tax=Flavobacterium sp. TaxID=239 RepID=UPI000C45BE25|nr:phytanoyl-CoA dioxygenase family protein [Flavobacterium sp.]MBF03358.1 hypothetical protein [Flavobacterium sp.]
MHLQITTTQLEQFYEQGFVKIENCLSLALLQKLRTFFDEVIADENDFQKVTISVGEKKFITNVELLCYKNNLACLELLGLPFLLDMAQKICGPDFFAIQEFAVIKNSGDQLPVLWHQDMMHQRTGNCFTVGIYVDDAHAGDGALKVVPKSHLSSKTICELAQDEAIEVPMKAGDILVHDMMLAHSSGILQKNEKRRVIYFEFLSAKQVATEEIYTAELVANRTQLLAVATSYYHLQNPLLPQFQWEKEVTCYENEAQIRTALHGIYAMPIHAKPSNYCFELPK